MCRKGWDAFYSNKQEVIDDAGNAKGDGHPWGPGRFGNGAPDIQWPPKNVLHEAEDVMFP